MVRSRPELPSDSESVGRDAVESSEAKKRRRQRRRDEKRDEAAEREPEAAGAGETPAEQSEASAAVDAAPADPERWRREVAAETAFRERVALTELASRLSPEAYAALERALAGRSIDWQLEKGRYLFTYLVGKRTVPVGASPVQVEQKLALSRDEPPAEPERVDDLVAEVVAPGEPVEENIRRLEPLRAEIPPGDEVRVRVAPDQPEIVVTAEAVTLDEVPAARGKRPEPEPTESPEPSPDPDVAGVERLITEVEREVEREVTAETPAVTADLAAATDTVPAADTASALALLEREAVDLHDLPPMRGGAPEADRLDREEPSEEPPDEREPEPAPPVPPDIPIEPEPQAAEEFPPIPGSGQTPERRSRRQRPGRGLHRSRGRSREIFRWDPDRAEVVRYPDHEMRRKARKLVRRLAAEYGIKLTPQIEAYLLGIILQPHLIGGRRVYSLGLNVDTLVSVLQVLKYQFNLTRRPGV